MVASGALLSELEFGKLLGVSQKRLARLLADGSVFTFEVDGRVYFPSLLADASHDLRKLQSICRILVPAPPESRLDFLTSRRGSLGDRSPLDMLESDDDFKSLKRVAVAWTAEWSRTAVTMYEGEHEAEPSNVEPLYTAVAEIDPRRPLWERASEALHLHGYEWPFGPYPEARQFTLFVERQTAGHSAPTPEACVQIVVDGEYIRVRIVAAPGTTLESETMPAGNRESFIDIAKRVIDQLTK
jgi:hypothetical protein